MATSVRTADSHAVTHFAKLDAAAATQQLNDIVVMLGNRRGRLRIATPQNGSDPRFERGSWFDSRGRKNDATESVKTLVNSAVKGLSKFRQNEVLHALDRYLATHQSGPTRSLQGVVEALNKAQQQQRSRLAPQPAPATQGAAAVGAAALSDRKRAFEQWAAVNIEGEMYSTLKMLGFPQPSETLCRAARQYAQAFMTKAITENVAGTHDSAALHRLFGKEWKKSEGRVFTEFRAIKNDAVASKIDPEIAMERATWQLRANEVTDAFQAMRQPSTSNNGAREKLHAEFNKIAADFARARFDDATRKAWLEQSAKARGLSSEAHAALMVTHKVSVILASDSVKALKGPQFETHLALVLARELVDDRGEIAQHDDIRRLRDALELGLAASPAVRDRLMDSLDRLSRDNELVSTLESINAPDSKNWAGQEMVRITLGLPPDPDAVLGRVEARVAALSALLAPLRQGSVGSCFATSQAIRLHDARPAEMLSDLKRLIEQGHLEFNVRGTTGPVKVPLSLLAGEADLDDTELKVEHEPAGPRLATAHREDPRLEAALQAIGLPAQGDNRDLAIRDALTGLTAASKQAQQAGEPAIKITPRALLEQIVFARANISYELRQKASQLPAKQEAYHRAAAAAPDADLMQLDKLGEARELMALDKELTDKIPRRESVGGYARYLEVQAEVARAISGYQSATDNRLLRAWEYTLSAAVEGEGSDLLLRQLQTKAREDVEPLIKAANAGPAGKQLLEEFKKLLVERMSYQYDASFQRQATAADGSSTEGAFVLHDRSGSDDPQRWRRIDSEVELRRLLGGLVTEAANAQAKANPAREATLLSLERSLSERLQTAPLPGLIDPRGTSGCWRWEQGYDTASLMAARAGLSVADARGTPLRSREDTLAELLRTPSRQTEHAASHQEIGEFLIERLKKMARAQDVQAAIEADRRNFSLTVSTQSHTFLFKPGLKLGGKDAPSMLDAATSKLKPDAWWNEKVVEPANKIAKAGLDPQQLSETTRALREVVNRTRDPSGLTVQDLPWPAVGDSGYAQWEGDLITLARELSAASSGNAGGAGAAAPRAVVEVTLPALRGAFERKLEEALRDRDVRNVFRPSNNAEQQRILDKAIREANKPVLERFMSLIDQEAARRHPPPPLVFADTNWRVGSQAIGFAFIRNPANARDELWQADIHDGRLLKREDDEQWRKGWTLHDNPALYLS
jgi:hypothetical protein